MKIREFKIVAVLLLLVSTSAVTIADDSNQYFGISLFNAQFEADTIPDFNHPGVSLRLGHTFNRHLSIEGQLGFPGDDTRQSLTLDPEYIASVFLRGDLPMNPANRVKVYGLLGYSYLKLDASAPGALGFKASGSDNDISYGVGIGLYGNDTTAVNLEYIRLFDKTDEGIDWNIDAVTLGFVHHFNMRSLFY